MGKFTTNFKTTDKVVANALAHVAKGKCRTCANSKLTRGVVRCNEGKRKVECNGVCSSWRPDSMTVAMKGKHKAVNMSAETAISRIEWMLGGDQRDRDEAASELEYYRSLIVARVGQSKYDEMMRRALNSRSKK